MRTTNTHYVFYSRLIYLTSYIVYHFVGVVGWVLFFFLYYFFLFIYSQFACTEGLNGMLGACLGLEEVLRCVCVCVCVCVGVRWKVLRPLCQENRKMLSVSCPIFSHQISSWPEQVLGWMKGTRQSLHNIYITLTLISPWVFILNSLYVCIYVWMCYYTLDL